MHSTPSGTAGASLSHCNLSESTYSPEQFSHDAPDAPHVHRRGVAPLAQQQLGGSVPQRHNHVGVGTQWGPKLQVAGRVGAAAGRV